VSRFGAKAAPWRKAAGRDEEAEGADTNEAVRYVPGAVGEEPAPALPPVIVYVLEREAGGWRPSIYEVPASLLVTAGKRIATHEPDIKALAIEQLMRHIEERRS
jgi:hypothetical protein